MVAVDGIDTNEIQLIDSIGCPTEMAIMTSVAKFAKSGKRLRTTFEAFKFPSSNTVQFRALITPCLSSCKPVQCNLLNTETGINQEFISYGRRRRRSIGKKENSTIDNGELDVGVARARARASTSASASATSGEVIASRDDETSSPMIEPLNNHYESVATSDQVNYRSMVHGITPGNRKAVNDQLRRKHETGNNNNYDPHLHNHEQVYTYNDQHSVHSSQQETTTSATQESTVDPKSQVVVVGAIKISDSFDFILDDLGKVNDPSSGSKSHQQRNKQMSPGEVISIDGEQVQVSSSSLLRKSLATINTNSNASSTVAGESTNCTDLIGLVIACSVFLLGQLIIIATWFYMYKKIQMYQWMSSNLFPVKASTSSSSASSTTSLDSSSVYQQSEKISTSGFKRSLGQGTLINSYSSPSPPAPVRFFRSRYPFEATCSSSGSKGPFAANSNAPFACLHEV